MGRIEAYKGIIVEVKDAYKKEIKLEGGLSLHLDQNIKQVKDTIRYGRVVAIPVGLTLDVQVGDILFFHHNIVSVTVMDGKPDIYSDFLIDIDKGLYFVPVNPDWPLAYARKRGGEIRALTGVCFIRPLMEEKKALSMVIHSKVSHAGDVVYPSPKMIEEGIVGGTRIYFRKNSEYPYYMGGELLYCMFDTRVLAVSES